MMAAETTPTLKNLAISKSESLADLENKFFQIKTEGPFKLRLPSALNSRGALGIEITLLQLIGTWLRSDGQVLHTYQDSKPEDFKELCKTIYGIAAISMANEIWDVRMNSINRNTALNEAKNTIQALRDINFEDAFVPQYFGVPYIKKPRYDREFFMPFYNGNEIINSEAFYGLFVKIIAERICYLSVSRFQQLSNMIDLQDLSDMAWEMLKNTHDHGRQEITGNLYEYNFRALIIQLQNVTSAYINNWCGNNPSFAQNKFRNYWNDKSDIQPFFDFSVVDFGEGFVKLARDKAPDLDDREIFLLCMTTGWSRLTENSRGNGLCKILNCVQKYKGWIRIRTNNILFEKTFLEDTAPDISLEDITIMNSEITGTSVHVSLPIKKFLEMGL